MAVYLVLIFINRAFLCFPMQTKEPLLSEFISKEPNAPVLVIFGGNPVKRNAVIQSLSESKKITIYGTLSEEEGFQTILKLPKVDLVLIGGRYAEDQRMRIKTWVNQNRPGLAITEPGLDYIYEEDTIKNQVYSQLKVN